MRSHLIGSIIVFSLTASLFSCAPKDNQLPPKVKNNVNSQGDSNSMNQTENNKLIAVSLDRTFAALALAKAAMNFEYANQLKLIIDEPLGVIDDSMPFDRILKAEGDRTIISTPGASFVTAVNYKITDRKFNEQRELIKLVLKSNDDVSLVSQGYLTVNNRPTDFKAVTMSDYIEIRKTLEEGLYSLTVKSIEDTSSVKDKSSVIDSYIKVKFAWNGKISSLEQEIAINLLEIKVNRTGQKKGVIDLKPVNTNLSVKLGECITANGDVVFAKSEKKSSAMPNETKPTVPEDGLQVVLKDSTVEIPKQKFSSKAQPCESRPLVDLTRML